MAKKPNPKLLSPRDRVATTAHLAETSAYNAKHAMDHQLAAIRVAKKLAKNNPETTTLWHNLEHAVKHTSDVKDHTTRLLKHLKTTYPGAKAMLAELSNPKPSNMPSKPGAIRGNKKTK